MRITKIDSINKNTRADFNKKIGYDYSRLFENMTEGVCIIDNLGYVQYVNSVYEKIFLVDRKNILGKNIFSIKSDDVLLTSHREKRSVQGILDYCIANKQIKSSASPIYVNDKFLGTISIYIQEDRCRSKVEVLKNLPSNREPVCNLKDSFKGILGKSEVMQLALCRAQKASLTTSTVLIRGESGTGKELVARAIHEHSQRSDKPFVKVNCGAIPSTLLESELFGHEQGAFTGAIRKKIGKFQQADGGTIFLDEIGDMPLEMQVKLLRVIQEKEFERIGGIETIRCDVRIIAATHRDLEKLMEKGSFREDLYYRLNVIPVYLPALRERREDIPNLCSFFIKKAQAKNNLSEKILTDEAVEALCGYDWPGNVRELENLIERLVVLTEGEVISLGDLPSYISNIYRVNDNERKKIGLINLTENGEMATLDEYEMEIIRHALQRFGSFNAAAKALGVTHKTVAFKARKYKIVD